MIKTPKISAYIPVYNYGKYVEEAINSVINQTFDDWELIVINDGSSDESEEIIARYESHPKITTVNQSNKGLVVSSNIALRLSAGEYIMRLDGDDFLDENVFMVMVSFLDKHQEISLVYPDYYLVNEKGDILSLEGGRKSMAEMISCLTCPRMAPAPCSAETFCLSWAATVKTSPARTGMTSGSGFWIIIRPTMSTFRSFITGSIRTA